LECVGGNPQLHWGTLFDYSAAEQLQLSLKAYC